MSNIEYFLLKLIGCMRNVLLSGNVLLFTFRLNGESLAAVQIVAAFRL